MNGLSCVDEMPVPFICFHRLITCQTLGSVITPKSFQQRKEFIINYDCCRCAQTFFTHGVHRITPAFFVVSSCSQESPSPLAALHLPIIYCNNRHAFSNLRPHLPHLVAVY